MKLSFVGAVLLISVLNTDAQGYPRPQGYDVPANYNPQFPGLGYPGSQGYDVPANYNPQFPGLSGFSNFLSALPSLVSKPLNMMTDMLDMVKKGFGVSSDPYNRPYPYNSQVGAPSNRYTGLPPHFVSSQIGASFDQYNGRPLASIQVTDASDSKNGPPLASSQLYNVRVPVPPQNAM